MANTDSKNYDSFQGVVKKPKNAPKNQRTVIDKAEYTKILNDEQKQLFDKLEEFLNDSEKRLFCIKGYAGTGKTFTLTRFFSYYTSINKRKKVCLTAPTNKATGVLKNSTPKEMKSFLEFSTIHKLLGIKATITENGEEIFEQKGTCKVNDYFVVVIDEVSMLDDELFFTLLKFEYVKFIFQGDPFQIPPINKTDCEPFLNPDTYKIETFELKKIMRQSDGNPIIDAGYYVRSNPDTKTYDFSTFHNKENLDFKDTSRDSIRIELKNEMNTLFSSDEFKADMGNYKVIAWRNAKVASYNAFIRNIYHNNKANAILPQLLVGEQIISKSPIMDDDQILVNTNTEMEIVALEDKATEVDSIHFGSYNVRVKYFDYDLEKYIEKDITVLKDYEKTAFQAYLNKLADLAKFGNPDKRKWHWQNFYKAKEIFADITFAYALTAHTSQGSTYKQVFVDVSDIMLNSKIVERNRIIYTAITRAAEKVTIIKNN